MTPSEIIPPRRFTVKSAPFYAAHALEKEMRIYSDELVHCPEIIRCVGDHSSLDEGTLVCSIVLEHPTAGSLSGLISEKGLPEAEVRDFTRMILRGLSRLHARGYVHCDLKPENVMVFPLNQLKLANFELAKEPNRKEDPCPGAFRGTPRYMSPESVAVGEVTTKLDIWSLGCIVAEMVTGRPAYDDNVDMNELVIRLGMMMEAPKIPEKLSDDGKEFLMRCFDVDPKKRASADELLGHRFVAESILV